MGSGCLGGTKTTFSLFIFLAPFHKKECTTRRFTEVTILPVFYLFLEEQKNQILAQNNEI
jgi:hypothetical protein